MVSPSIFHQFLNEADCEAGKISPAYRHGNNEIIYCGHGFMVSIYTIAIVLSRVLESVHSYQVWYEFHEHFHK